MKKLLTAAAFLCALAPGLALASTYADVSLVSGSVNLSINGITLNVNGATLDQINVYSGSFDVVLDPGSTITVVAPNLNKLNTNPADTLIASAQCNSSGSNLTLTASASAATTTITVTPTSTICGAVTQNGSGNGPVSSGGGGGGGGAAIVTTPTTVPLTTTSTTANNATLIAQLQAQLNALLAQIAALTGGSVGGGSFTRDMQVGSTGSDAKSLQMYLNSHGFPIASSGPGSPGNETSKFGGLTRAALAKFQAANGISPAAGYFGPKTRAYIAAHP